MAFADRGRCVAAGSLGTEEKLVFDRDLVLSGISFWDDRYRYLLLCSRSDSVLASDHVKSRASKLDFSYGSDANEYNVGMDLGNLSPVIAQYHRVRYFSDQDFACASL